MYIADRLFSERYEETLFSVALSEEEYDLYSEFLERMYAATPLGTFVNGKELSHPELLEENARLERATNVLTDQMHGDRARHEENVKNYQKMLIDRDVRAAKAAEEAAAKLAAEQEAHGLTKGVLDQSIRQHNVTKEEAKKAAEEAAKKLAAEQKAHAAELAAEQEAHGLTKGVLDQSIRQHNVTKEELKKTAAERKALASEGVLGGAKRRLANTWGEGGVKAGWKKNWKGRAGLIGAGAAAAGTVGMAGYGAHKAIQGRRKK